MLGLDLQLRVLVGSLTIMLDGELLASMILLLQVVHIFQRLQLWSYMKITVKQLRLQDLLEQ
jgi:hypothetical protein